MNEVVKVIFGLAGGLAMFLFGMTRMSDALQKAAGERMKKVLQFLTKNPVMGALAGAIVTAVLQSSSATTVMTIGFVSAGLMSLPQAISVIFGANIGTTMTAQLIAFDISDYIYPIIFIGFIMNFAFKNEKVKDIGMVIFSFGLLFEGIEVMGSVMKPLADSQFFLNMMSSVKNIPVLGVLVGMCMTLVVQSSSATIAVLQSFASQPAADGVSSVVGLMGAIPILLGDNIGTTITALISSIGQKTDAKRTAIAHTVFNVTGTVLFMFLLRPFAAFVTWISPKGNEVDVISRQIANAHTTFNICMTLIWLPLIPLMVKIVTTIIPDRKKEAAGAEALLTGKSVAEYIEPRLASQPLVALRQLSREIKNQSELTDSLLLYTRKAATGKENAFKDFKKRYEVENRLYLEINSFVNSMFEGGLLSDNQGDETASLLAVSESIRRIADRCKEITAVFEDMKNRNQAFTDTATDELKQCFKISENLFNTAFLAAETGDAELARTVLDNRDRMFKARKKFNKAHLKRVEKGICSAELSVGFDEVLGLLNRITDNSIEIAEEAMDSLNMESIENV